MKKLILCLLMLLTVSVIFAQTPEITTSPEVGIWSLFKSIMVPAILAQFLVLFSDAKKYYTSPEWSWNIFFTSKIKPFLFTTIGGIILLVILNYLPIANVFIEILIGSPISSITAASLFGAASAIIDGFIFKSKK
jgi:hypothetical protein